MDCAQRVTLTCHIMVNNLFNKYVIEKKDMLINYVDRWDMEGDGSVRRVNYFQTIE